MNNANADAGVAMTPDSGPPPPQGLPILGNGTHSLAEVVLEVVADASDDLNLPTDLEFHPDRASELWVTNEGSSQFWVGTDLGTDLKSVNSIEGRGAHLHFLTKPSGLAFGDQYCGAERCLATSHGNVNDQPRTTGNAPVDFMGPSLWTSDVTTYRGSGPYHAAHYDMLHNSPDAMGIAWDKGNAFGCLMDTIARLPTTISTVITGQVVPTIATVKSTAGYKVRLQRLTAFRLILNSIQNQDFFTLRIPATSALQSWIPKAAFKALPTATMIRTVRAIDTMR